MRIKDTAIEGLRTVIFGSKDNPIKNFLNDPEKYKIEVYLERDEIVVRFKPRVTTVTQIRIKKEKSK